MRKRWIFPFLAITVLTLVALVPTPASADHGCTIAGTSGDDNLPGTPGNDKICGFGGNDTVFGFAGDDIVTAGSGDDRVNGGKDDDVLKGGPGDDNLQADDLIPGNDSARGNRGTDICSIDPGDSALGCETVLTPSTIQTVSEDIPVGARDWWSFTGSQGDEYGVLMLRTTSGLDPFARICNTPSIADCFETADDNFDCPVAGPFECPELQGNLPSDGDGVYYISAESFALDSSDSYTLSLGEYIGTGFGALTLAQDDA